jgi:hypothetical protein
MVAVIPDRLLYMKMGNPSSKCRLRWLPAMCSVLKALEHHMTKSQLLPMLVFLLTSNATVPASTTSIVLLSISGPFHATLDCLRQ